MSSYQTDDDEMDQLLVNLSRSESDSEEKETHNTKKRKTENTQHHSNKKQKITPSKSSHKITDSKSEINGNHADTKKKGTTTKEEKPSSTSKDPKSKEQKPKEQKDTKEHKEQKDTKEHKDVKELKDAKEDKDTKEHTEEAAKKHTNGDVKPKQNLVMLYTPKQLKHKQKQNELTAENIGIVIHKTQKFVFFRYYTANKKGKSESQLGRVYIPRSEEFINKIVPEFIPVLKKFVVEKSEFPKYNDIVLEFLNTYTPEMYTEILKKRDMKYEKPNRIRKKPVQKTEKTTDPTPQKVSDMTEWALWFEKKQHKFKTKILNKLIKKFGNTDKFGEAYAIIK
jgi:hypothetical protein